MSAGMVENRAHHHSGRGRPVQACHATEAILFERTTFLVIATSAPPDDGRGQAANDLSSTRYERTS